MEESQAPKTNRLRLTGKVLGGGYLVFALIILWRAIQDLVAIWTPATQRVYYLQPLSRDPLVTLFLIGLLVAIFLAVIGLRLFAARRTRFTWIAVSVSVVLFPIGTLLGIASLIWLIVARRQASPPPSPST